MRWAYRDKEKRCNLPVIFQFLGGLLSFLKVCFHGISLHSLINSLFTYASLRVFKFSKALWLKHSLATLADYIELTISCLVFYRRQSFSSLGSAWLVKVVDCWWDLGKRQTQKLVRSKQWVTLRRRSKFSPTLNKEEGHHDWLWNAGCLFSAALDGPLVVSTTFGARIKEYLCPNSIP